MSLILDGSTGISGSAGVIDAETFAGQANTYYTDISARLGYTPLSNVNPSYSGTLTGNTGIINIGSGQFYKDANGQVGIGTSVPDNALTIQDSGAGVNKRFSIRNGDSTNSHKLTMGYNAGALSGFIPSGSVFITGETNGGFGILASLSVGTISATPIIFGTSNTENMRIESSGNVGIGTTAPNAKLELSLVSNPGTTNFSGGANNLLLFAASGSGYGEPAVKFQEHGTDVGAVIAGKNTQNGAMSIVFANRSTSSTTSTLTERMRIDSSGNVGIGTASPSGKLHVNGGSFDSFTISGNSANSVGMRFQNSAASSRNYNIGSSGGGPSPAGTFFIYDDTAGATRMTINSSGNVGIGTTAGTTTVSSGLAINNATAANYPGLEIQTAGVTRLYFNANNAESYITSVSTNPLVITTNGTERMRINSSGNVGIGTTSPQAKLAVSNGGAAGLEFFVNYPGGGVGTYIQSYNRSSPGYVSTAYDAADHSFRISGTEKMRLDSAGNLLVGATSTTWTNSDAVMLAIGNGDSSFLHSSVRGDGTRFIWFVYNTNHIGSIAQSGTTGVAYVTTSDYRLKENVAPMTGALTKVAQLKPVTYTWKADGSDGQGFIAHELQAVVPDCVTGEKDAVDNEGNPEYQGVDTSFLVATLTAAIQELKSIIDQQDARIKTLEGKV